MRLQHLMAEAAVEKFNVGVLGRLAGLDVMKLHFVFLAPRDELCGDELRSVVDPDLAGQSPAVPKLFEHPDNAFGRQGGIHLDGQCFAHAFVEDVECPEPFAMPQGVVHEVHRPQVSSMGRHIERLPHAGRQALAGTTREIKFHGLVNPVNPLVVPGFPALPQPVEAFPKPPAAVPGDHFVEPVDDGLIPGVPVGSWTIPDGAADVHRLAGELHRLLLFLDQPVGGFAPLDWHQSFFSI